MQIGSLRLSRQLVAFRELKTPYEYSYYIVVYTEIRTHDINAGYCYKYSCIRHTR